VSSLEKLYFSSTSSVKETVVQQADIFYNASDDQLYFKDLPDGLSTVSIYRLDGRKIIQTQVSNEGSVDMSPFQHGLYLIRVNDKASKFVK
jgi:hypothetical protein